MVYHGVLWGIIQWNTAPVTNIRYFNVSTRESFSKLSKSFSTIAKIDRHFPQN